VGTIVVPALVRAGPVRIRRSDGSHPIDSCSAIWLAYSVKEATNADRQSVVPVYQQHAPPLSPLKRHRARRLRSGMTVLRRRDCEGGCCSWRLATCRFDAVTHNAVTFLRKPLVVAFWNGKCIRQFCDSRSVTQQEYDRSRGALRRFPITRMRTAMTANV
jgi:hypothetical protein